MFLSSGLLTYAVPVGVFPGTQPTCVGPKFRHCRSCRSTSETSGTDLGTAPGPACLRRGRAGAVAGLTPAPAVPTGIRRLAGRGVTDAVDVATATSARVQR